MLFMNVHRSRACARTVYHHVFIITGSWVSTVTDTGVRPGPRSGATVRLQNPDFNSSAVRLVLTAAAGGAARSARQ